VTVNIFERHSTCASHGEFYIMFPEESGINIEIEIELK
jgi:hypothetical protein